MLKGKVALVTGSTSGIGLGIARAREGVHRMLHGLGDAEANERGRAICVPVEEFLPKRWQAIQDIVLNARFHTIRAALPGMRQRGWGRGINLVAVHGLVAHPSKAPLWRPSTDWSG